MRRASIAIGLLLAAALLSACGGPARLLTDSQALVDNGQLTPVVPRQVSGTILISGSSTVYPLSLRMAREFRMAGSPAEVMVGVTGTGGGFRAFCAGAPLDIVDASRLITAEETAACQARGREPVAFQVGIDALSVVVASSNSFAQSLSFAQLAQIFTGQARSWDQVDPSFPAQPIAIFSPGEDSGTFDFFVDQVLAGDGDALLSAPGAVFSEDDDALRQAIASNPYAIGYFGYAYYRSAGGKLRALQIDAGAGPVAPSAATATDGSYPLARPLFIYSSADILQTKPAVAAFISYYVRYVDLQIDEVGYFRVAPATLARNQADLVAALQ